MDPNNAVEIRNVSKSFKIEVVDRERSGSLFNKTPMKTVVNKVLDDISLDIGKGEVIGILGRNGSGKSTLLSLIARIMEPDSGTIERSGRIASILELGMGFHPDMSGRENIYLKGELYGFSRAEMDTRIDKIIEYSDISKYIDNPVRTYSSGMSGRLAFSVMMNVESEIMLVDEILSVGDAIFKTKAKEHFRKLAKSGKTVVFVSHSIMDMEEMCTRAVWIENGKIIKDGKAEDICAEYRNKMSSSPEIVADLAEAGIADSQYELAMMYRDGTGFGKSEELYREWMKRASDQGHTLAQVAYADILMGEGGDTSEAVSLYRSAANKGNNDARRKISSIGKGKDELGEKIKEIFLRMAEEGEPINMFRCADYLLKTAWTEEDRQLAFKWFERSAENGYPNAMHQVGLMYRDGLGTFRDNNKMAEWLDKASEMGFLPSITLMADIYFQGRLVPKDTKKAFDLYLKGAELGNGKCQYQVAVMYSNGEGTDIDIEKSDKWFEMFSHSTTIWNNIWAADWAKMFDYDPELIKAIYWRSAECASTTSLGNILNLCICTNDDCSIAVGQLTSLAEKGNLDAYKRLGNLFYDGVGVEKDYSKSYSCYEKIAYAGDPWCLNRLGEMSRDGKGHMIDLIKAYMWFSKSSDFENINSILNIIYLYSTGLLEMDDHYEEYLGRLKCLAKLGSSDAARKLGNMHYDGTGVKRDFVKAIYWYEIAALLGDRWCLNRIYELRDVNLGAHHFQKDRS